jgi:hypothetical protein
MPPGEPLSGRKHILPQLVHRRQAISGHEIDDPSDVELVEGITGHGECIGALLSALAMVQLSSTALPRL